MDIIVKRISTVLLLLALYGVAAQAGDDDAAAPSWAKVTSEQIAEAKKHAVPVAFENDLGMRFVLIPSGTFVMGSLVSERLLKQGDDHEARHRVTISRPYYLQVHEVSNGVYRKKSPDHHLEMPPDLLRLGKVWESIPLDDDNHPILSVRHKEAVAFADWLTKRTRTRKYRLPTEAEWEYACRAGSTTTNYWDAGNQYRCANTADVTLKNAVAGDAAWTHSRPGWPIPPSWLWTTENDGFVMTSPVGVFQPNAYGLYDMLGNAAEWCADWYGSYPTEHVTDPSGPTKRQARHPKWPQIDGKKPPPRLPRSSRERASDPPHVLRGGSWRWPQARAAARSPEWPISPRFYTTGFRLVSPLPKPGRVKRTQR